MRDTVVAVFIKNKKLLIEKRLKSRKVYAGFLMCPAGHIKEKESFFDALRREMKEELGITVNDSKYLFTIKDIDPFSKVKFRHNFILIESYENEIKKSKEAKNLMWMSYPDLKKIKLVTIVDKLVTKLHKENLI